MDSGLSASDIALLGNDGGFGSGNAFIWIFALLILANGGFGGWGANRNSDFGQYATAASQQEILFGQQFQTLNQAINKVGDGISSLGYSQLQQMDANTASINGNIVNEGRNLQSQIADCCCSTKEAIAQVRYDMANFNAQTTATIHAEAEATRNMLQQNKIESLQAQINQLNLQNAMAGVVRYPNGLTYNAGTSPFCNCNCGCTGLATV